MQWFVSGREVFIGHELPVKVERIDPPPPFGQEKLQLSKMLSEGALHGAVVPGDSGYLGLFGGGETPPMMAAYPGVKPLFEDNEEIIHYTKQTGINPIMHVLSIRREIVERYPDFPGEADARLYGSSRRCDGVHGRQGNRRLRERARRARRRSLRLRHGRE